MKWSFYALVLGFCIDLLLGDPHGFPHPVVLIGKLIDALGRLFRALLPKTKSGEIAAGALLWVFTAAVSTAIPALLLIFAQKISVWLRLALESVMCWQILATKSLRDESMKVYAALQTGSLSDAQKAVSMIVGRDTNRLDEKGVARAAVETVAENTSDGVIAPLLFLAIGGAPLGFFYKAVNTMDSMLGYTEPPYKNIGLVPAKMDDFFNFLPARLSALFLLAAGFFPAAGCEKRLADFQARPLQARKPQLRTDRVRVRGAAWPPAGGRRVVPRRAAQKGVYRRRGAGDRICGHSAHVQAHGACC